MKELYIAALEDLIIEFMDQGLSWQKAYDKASDQAYDVMRDRLADMADNERKRRRENG